MELKKYFTGISLALALGLTVTSCGDDDLGESIFPDVPTTADPSSATYKFDTWLNENFRDVYNMSFEYRLDDNETNYDYRLTPATLDNSMRMAVLTKYVWYDAYAEAYGKDGELDPEFIRQTGPKMINLIGSLMYMNTGGVTLGYATGGVKITLCDINAAVFERWNMNNLNNRYFHTMHHEFTHILHQTKSYPTAFNEISNGRYDGTNWQNKNGGIMASVGFVTPYASSSYTEDFAETVSNYITRTDADYEMLYWVAERGWYTEEDDENNASSQEKTAYAYYYYINEDDLENEKKTYFMSYHSDEYNTSIRIKDSSNNKEFSTPEAVEQYLSDYTEVLRLAFKRRESQRRYGVTYEQATPEQKAIIDDVAANRQFIYPVEDSDKCNGREVMENKINIARNWFREAWNIDLDRLRTIVQRRSADFDMDVLLRQIDAIPDPQ